MKGEEIFDISITVLCAVLFVSLADGVLSHLEFTITERIFLITLWHGGMYGALCYNVVFKSINNILEAYMFIFGHQSLKTPVDMIVWIIWGFQHTGFPLGLFYSLILQPLRPILSNLGTSATTGHAKYRVVS